jgi:hypothetical protein
MIIITMRLFPCSWATSTTVGAETTVETETTVVIIEQKTLASASLHVIYFR